MENLPQKYMVGIWLLRGLLNERLGNIEESGLDFENARKFDNASVQFLDHKQSIQLTVFPLTDRLCTQFPYVDINFIGHPTLVFPHNLLNRKLNLLSVSLL